MSRKRKTQALLVGLTVATLAPFLNKAFHIDDPLFIWMAQQITGHPLDPFGFTANWYSEWQPMSWIMQNPPLNSYYIALAASVTGWSEPALHAAFMLPAVAAVLGTFALARRLCLAPFLAAALTLFTPVFLVSGTSVMSDVMLLAFWVWSVEFWLAGVLQRQPWRCFTAVVLISCAAFTKYFGISLVPLLAVYTIARERRVSFALAFLLLPILAVAGFEWFSRIKYGHGLFSAAEFYVWKSQSATGQFLLGQFLTGLCFTGGCLISVLSYVRVRNWRMFVAGGVALAASAVVFHFVLARPYPVLVSVEGGVFVLIGVGALSLAVADLSGQRDADSLLLLLWLFGTFFFAAFFNWSITARTFLPMAPAVAILLTRRLKLTDRYELRPLTKNYWRLLPAIIICLGATAGDYRFANAGREASRQFQLRFEGEPHTVWFQGHWGFQYYMQQWGARPLDFQRSRPLSGEIVIVPENGTNLRPLPVDQLNPPDEILFPQFQFITTFGFETGAGFYASGHGPLPWFAGRVPPERYKLARVE